MRMPKLDIRMVRQSVQRAQADHEWFGRHSISTSETVRMLERHDVRTYLEELPPKYAALLSPVAVAGRRSLILGRHVPRLARQLVLLHEAGHLYQRTAELGIAYDSDDWRTPAELAADAFAAVALFPTVAVDGMLASTIWTREIEDDVARELAFISEGLWDPKRALAAARNRLIIREEVGV